MNVGHWHSGTVEILAREEKNDTARGHNDTVFYLHGTTSETFMRLKLFLSELIHSVPAL